MQNKLLRHSIEHFYSDPGLRTPNLYKLITYKHNLSKSFEIRKQQKISVFAFGARKIITINLFHSTLLVKLGFTTKAHASELV